MSYENFSLTKEQYKKVAERAKAQKLSIEEYLKKEAYSYFNFNEKPCEVVNLKQRLNRDSGAKKS